MRNWFLYRIVRKIMTSSLVSKSDLPNGSYQDAVHALNSLQSNAATVEKIRQERDSKRHMNIPNMIHYLERTGITVEDFSKLSVIHISGTKGKGSTSALCESVLRHCGYKTGFFSSPHMVKVTERFRINGQPIVNDKFSQYFWEVYHKLKKTKVSDQERQMPAYFAFLTVMAVHVFLKEKVDVAIFEVGIGGQFDCTNIFPSPVVCGVTSLGLDHTSILGDTLDKIAWQKAGIFKPGVPAVTVSHPEEATRVLLDRSKEIGSPLYMAPALDLYAPKGRSIELGIAGSIQAVNASLALQLCRIWIDNHSQEVHNRKWLNNQSEVKNPTDIPEIAAYKVTDGMLEGLKSCSWPGRNQIVCRPGVTYYLDGAHTIESIEQCVQWFQTASRQEAQKLKGRVCRILLFNATRDRNVTNLLSLLKVCEFDAAVFSPNLSYSGPNSNTADQTNNTVTKEKQLITCQTNQKIWDELVNGYQSAMFVSATTVKGDRLSGLNEKDKKNNAESESRPNLESNFLNGFDDCNTNASIEMNGNCNPISHAFPCILQALHWATQGRDPVLAVTQETKIPGFPESLRTASHIQILVTGSLHLVGGALGLLYPELRE